jgi:hypothetical protein
MAREMTMSISSPVMVRRCSNSAASERTTLSYRCRMLLTSTRQAAIYASRDSRELVINDASSRSSLLSSAAGHGSPGRNNSSATVPAANSTVRRRTFRWTCATSSPDSPSCGINPLSCSMIDILSLDANRDSKFTPQHRPENPRSRSASWSRRQALRPHIDRPQDARLHAN